MAKKFTQGEWKITDNCLDACNAGWYQIGTDKCKWLVDVKGTHVGPKDIDEIKANAKLIIAAPDLLEACEKAIEMCEYALNKVNYGASNFDAKAIQQLNEAPILLKNAIKKAIGE